ncbi:MAG TPA: hypothetical protein PKI03_10490 [Pseudomonadota bacterium]|nr:hypothetical protein [Pseudomonadota bacterium]
MTRPSHPRFSYRSALPLHRPTTACLSLLTTASLGLLAVPAWAQQPTATLSSSPAATPAAQLAVIVAMPFDGRDVSAPPRKPITPMPTAAAISDALMVRPQAAKYRVLTADIFAGIARLKYRGRPADLRAMGRLLKAKVMLGGWIEATPGPEAPKPYRLTLTLYDGEGQLLGQLGYDVESPYIETAKFLSQSTAFLQMLDTALGFDKSATPAVAVTSPVASSPAPVTAPAPTPVASRPTAVTQYDDREAAPLTSDDKPLVPRTKAAEDERLRRPPWLPTFVLRAGYLYSSRALSNDGSTIGFQRSGAHGAVIHAELYPLAFWRGASDALAGLGLRFTAQLPQWGDIKQQSQVGGATTGSVSATERRLEVGLRWHLNPWDRVLRPDFELEALYGDHLFGFSNPINLIYVSLPTATYRYMGAQFGASLFVTNWLQLRGGFLFSKHLSLGSMTTVGVDADGNSLREQNGYQSYGPGNGWMWRTDWSATGHIWRGIHAGFAFFFEQNKLSFDGKGNIYQTSGMPVVRAQDEYLGVMLTVGYAFQGKRSPRPAMTTDETSETAPATGTPSAADTTSTPTAQPYPAQPYPAQPYPAQPTAQPYPTQTYPAQPTAQPYPAQTYPRQPAPLPTR